MSSALMIVSDLAYAQHVQIQACARRINEQFLELAAALSEFAAADGWRALGYDSFYEYLAQPEVDINYRSARRLIRIHERFVLEMGCDTVSLLDAGVAKLDILARPGSVNASNVDEWLARAATLSRSDLLCELGNALPAHSGSVTQAKAITCAEDYRAVMHGLCDVRDPAQRRAWEALTETWRAARRVPCVRCGHAGDVEPPDRERR